MDGRARKLLTAIAANATDNEARLVFADHIAPMFPAHAALIVAQCTGVDAPELHEAFLSELPEPLREHDQVFPVRGFLEHAQWELEERDFLELDPDLLLRLAPACTGIAIQDAANYDAIGARLDRFETFRIVSSLFDTAAARRFAAARGFGHLRELALECDLTSVDDDALIDLWRSLPALERVTLAERRAPAASILRIVEQARCATQLRALAFWGRDNVAIDLHGFPALRDLEITGGMLDHRFAALPNRFERLRMDQAQIADDLLPALTGSSVLSELRELELVGNKNQAAWCVPLLAFVGPVRRLEVNEWYSATNEDGVSLARAIGNFASSLEWLALHHPLDLAAFRLLAQTQFPELSVFIHDKDLTTDAAELLANAPWIGRLRELRIDGDLLDDDEATVALTAALSPDCRIAPWYED